MPGASSIHIVGNQPIAFGDLPDTTARQQPGTMISATGDYWGGRTVIYARAAGTIAAAGLCVLTPVTSGSEWRFNMTEVPNTANLGRPLYVAMAPMTSGQFGWFVRQGIVPVACNASVAADATFGIAAAGQGGANSAGKQILNARVAAPATTTVVKAATANSGSTQLTVRDSSGWFPGVFLSGTGIAATTTVTSISPDGTQVTISLATTAAINGNVTATYNNGTIFYNVAHIDNPIAQGAIT
jgi:hypothetical protein